MNKGKEKGKEWEKVKENFKKLIYMYNLFYHQYFKRLMIIIIGSWLLISCNNSNIKTKTAIIDPLDSVQKKIFEQKCLACHGFEGKTDEQMIAPPMFAVKKRYLRASSNKEEFVNLMSEFVKNPQKETGLMKGALDRLGVMPHLNYDEHEILKIVNYIYETDMVKPDWFDAHQRSHQGQNKKNREDYERK